MTDNASTRRTRTLDLIGALEHPRWRELLTTQLESKPENLVSNYYKLSYVVFSKLKRSDLEPSLADSERLLELGLLGDFPETEHAEHPRRTILHFVHSVAQPSFAEVIERHLGDVVGWDRSFALRILCRLPDDNSFETLIRLLERYPDSPLQFRDLTSRHWVEVRRVLPRLLVHAYDPDYLASITNVINEELEHGRLEAAALAPTATPVQTEALRLLIAVEARQQPRGAQWRSEQEYEGLSVPLGVYLDLLGVIPGTSPDALERAQKLNDPRLVLFATVSLLKKGLQPEPGAVRRCASNHAVRDDLYRQLTLLGRPDLFPPEYLNLESFAACDMVRWLMFPSELGCEPEALELMATVTGTTDDGCEARTFLWKCTPSDGPAFACANGPYSLNAEVGELTGGSAFSNFTAWDEATPEEHLAGIADTLENWRVSWCNERS